MYMGMYVQYVLNYYVDIVCTGNANQLDWDFLSMYGAEREACIAISLNTPEYKNLLQNIHTNNSVFDHHRSRGLG
jgi:hypothetical protein